MEQSQILSAGFPGCHLDEGSLLVSSNHVWTSNFCFIFRPHQPYFTIWYDIWDTLSPKRSISILVMLTRPVNSKSEVQLSIAFFWSLSNSEVSFTFGPLQIPNIQKNNWKPEFQPHLLIPYRTTYCAIGVERKSIINVGIWLEDGYQS